MKSIEDLKKNLKKIKDKDLIKKRVFKDKIPESFRICVEISSAIIAGLIVGAILDAAFGFKYVFKIISLILGCIASFRVLYNLMIKK